jgi:hypothetical protein
VSFTVLEQLLGVEYCKLSFIGGNSNSTQYEAACRVHKGDQVKITVCGGGYWRIIQLEHNPSFVDLELVRVEFGSAHVCFYLLWEPENNRIWH